MERPPLSRLRKFNYRHSGKLLPAEILATCRFLVIEETDYDNWNGGSNGHDVKFFLPDTTLGKIPLAKQNEIAEQIRLDLRACSESVQNEYFHAVSFELNDEQDAELWRCRLVTDRISAHSTTSSGSSS